MKKNTLFGIGLGIIAGLFDLIPMIIQDLSWNANLSAFSMWVVVGFLVSVTQIQIHEVLKAILIAFLVLLPNLFIIGAQDPVSLIPVAVMTLFLSSLLGFFYQKVADNTDSQSKNR
ncbi:MAG: hypothetical protein A2X13_09120 [Bacteroidetes bacterium GWC2_33_15]|nr:MAG: hypothetical protein A2X10_01750 [Bacteroidetes bacterium GWA2_33_15]OFX49110.1 MAG: hypothetical protein A2X13_09120 [Bacteroidetes bacterium GWC2_33_15]OFX64878.1 MAG: hypothetical protein A2X15_05995 [Bacteroidetes bacterium GWB2_32_14]OFX68586.1 MAG: hypothetical protein A2X14_14560 [Bacteroidetes bacterium GWD2_33_33]HAN17432.1 hypothetical protein [Bacteroidales bacterium]